MVSFYDGRNLNTIENSKSKCLLENWVEERATSEIDATKRTTFECGVNLAKLKDSHAGLLSTSGHCHTMDLTTHLDKYRPNPAQVPVKGARAAIVEKMLFEKALKELEKERVATEEASLNDPTTSDYKTTFNDSYALQFTPTQPPPTHEHDYKVEQPITFWSDHTKKIHGVSQANLSFDCPFKKNAAFSTPVHLQFAETNPPPYERSHISNL